jgi:hypothetical protein
VQSTCPFCTCSLLNVVFSLFVCLSVIPVTILEYDRLTWSREYAWPRRQLRPRRTQMPRSAHHYFRSRCVRPAASRFNECEADLAAYVWNDASPREISNTMCSYYGVVGGKKNEDNNVVYGASYGSGVRRGIRKKELNDCRPACPRRNTYDCTVLYAATNACIWIGPDRAMSRKRGCVRYNE